MMNSKFKLGAKVKIANDIFIIAAVDQKEWSTLYNLINIEDGGRWLGRPLNEDDFINELKEMDDYYGLEVVENLDKITDEPPMPPLPFTAGDLIHCQHKGLGWQAIKEVMAILKVTDSIETIKNELPVVVLGNIDPLRRQMEKCEYLFLSEIEILDIYKRQPVKSSTPSIAESESEIILSK